MGSEHFRHPISVYRHRLGFDRRDCSQMGIIRRIEIVRKPGEERFRVDVHCLQYGRNYTVRFGDDEVCHIDVYFPGRLTLDSLQEELDQCRENVDQANEFFADGDDYVRTLEDAYRDFIGDLVPIMKTNGIYSRFNFELILARHYLGQMT